MTTPNSSPTAAPIEDGARYMLSEHFMLREIAGEALLIPLPSSGLPGNAMITLNATSVFLFRLLAKPCTMDELLAGAREAYDDPANMLETNIREFIAVHVKSGIICIV